MDPVSRTPTKPIDYATLSAGYGALTGALLVAARSRAAQPIRPAELPVMGLATFALAGANDWLQSGFTTLCAEANVAQRRASQPAEAGSGDGENVTRLERQRR